MSSWALVLVIALVVLFGSRDDRRGTPQFTSVGR